jgi:hypothetical protein
MAAMRILLLASALTSSRAATAIHVVEKYSASGCDPANLMWVKNDIGECSRGYSKWQTVTCNETHYQMTFYSGAQCTGTPFESLDGDDSIRFDSSGCTQHSEGYYMKVKCNEELEQPIALSLISYTDDTCATKAIDDAIQTVVSPCMPESDWQGGSDGAPGTWETKSTKWVYTPGVALAQSKHASTDCSGTPTESTTFTCGVCQPVQPDAGVIVTCPSGTGSASSGRRSTPWAVATFGAAALAMMAAQHATA